MNIKKSDSVYIVKGKDAGQTGKVLKVFPKEGKVRLDGLNVMKKARRPRREGEHGEMVSLAMPIRVENVRLVCPACHKPTRIGLRAAGQVKERYCKKCQATI
ncbi:MAG TPA: 50S ribosomal protein L24 [Candidatus Tyrphobacter sp.]|nr:50S ribosomal protein L24 [Candidatus Tyrphobacter sp.]